MGWNGFQKFFTVGSTCLISYTNAYEKFEKLYNTSVYVENQKLTEFESNIFFYWTQRKSVIVIVQYNYDPGGEERDNGGRRGQPDRIFHNEMINKITPIRTPIPDRLGLAKTDTVIILLFKCAEALK